MSWRFLDYLDARGTNPIRTWLDDLPDRKAETKIRTLLLNLTALPRLEPPYVKPITGYDGIFEIRVGRQGIQYRPLGCYGPGRGEFTLLIGATEQGDEIRPPRAFEIATGRRVIILNERSRTCDHDFGSASPDHRQPTE